VLSLFTSRIEEGNMDAKAAEVLLPGNIRLFLVLWLLVLLFEDDLFSDPSRGDEKEARDDRGPLKEALDLLSMLIFVEDWSPLQWKDDPELAPLLVVGLLLLLCSTPPSTSPLLRTPDETTENHSADARLLDLTNLSAAVIAFLLSCVGTCEIEALEAWLKEDDQESSQLPSGY
jgi:hypothetical protein